MTVVSVLHAATGILLAVAAVLVLIRLLRGPAIVDRMVASDLLVTIVVLALVAEMTIGHHLRSLPLVLAVSGTAVLGAIAVARYISKQDRTDHADGAREPRRER